MKTNWPVKKLGEVLILKDSGVWGFEDSSGVKVLRSTNFRNDGSISFDNVAFRSIDESKLKVKLLGAGDILLERSGGGPNQPVGRVVLYEKTKDTFTFGNFITRLRPSKEILSKFLFLCLFQFHLSGKTNQLQKQTTGIRNLRFGEYLDIEIPVPGIEEQKRIVAKLEKILSKIQEAKKLRQKAADDTSLLWESAVKNLSAKKGWDVKRLDEIAEINPKKSEVANLPIFIKVSFVPMSAVDEISGTITQPEVKTLDEVKNGYTYFKEDDVIFAKITPCMENGKVAVARSLENNIGFGSTEFHVIRSTAGTPPEWLHAYLRQKGFRDEAQRHMTGTAGQQRIPKDYLESIEIPVPPEGEKEKIVEYLDSLSEKVRILRQAQAEQLAELEALKASVLHQAFQGKI